MDMEKVRVLREKDAENERLRQQVRQLQVSVWNLYKCVCSVLWLNLISSLSCSVYIVDWEIFMLETIRLNFFLVLHFCSSFDLQNFFNS